MTGFFLPGFLKKFFFFFLHFPVGNFKENFGEKISLKSIGNGAEFRP